MDLLNFLIYWSQRVYEWFGGLYDRGRQAALYSLSWAISYAAQALTGAIQWADNRTNGALSTAWNWIQQKYNDAIAYAYAVRDFLLSKLYEFRDWAAAQVIAVQNWAAGAIRAAQDYAAGLVAGINSWVAARLVEIQNHAAGLVQGVQNWAAEKVANIDNRLTSINNLVFGQNSAGTPILGTFLSNPFGFILAYVFGAFQDLLCFGLAYGLGSTKYDLPPLPDWNGGGITGGYLPPSTLPPGTAGLTPPLNSISVSGYRFDASHKGIDLGLANGDPVYAMHDGRVLEAQFSQVGYGFNVVVSGGDWWTRYAHLASLAVNVGDTVRAGQAVGAGDSTGNSSGPHLHLEIKFKGQFIDPLTVL